MRNVIQDLYEIIEEMATNLHTKRSQRFIDPEILSKISNLELRARSVVEGFISGLHKSPFKGFSVEFMEYRQYVPGDDLKRIDWKLYARSDRLFVKEFEDETNTTCHILMDISKSMEYTSGGITKLEYASYLAASLAYFMIRQRDSVGLYLFDSALREQLSPKSTAAHLHSILTVLDGYEPGADSEMKKPFSELAEAVKRPGIVIVISDLLDEADKIINGMRHLKFNGSDVILFHLLDREEQKFDFSDIVEFEDMESGEKLLVVGETAQEIYQANFDRHCETVTKQTGIVGVDYCKLITDKPLDFALFKYLAARSRQG